MKGNIADLIIIILMIMMLSIIFGVSLKKLYDRDGQIDALVDILKHKTMINTNQKNVVWREIK